jgi:hypothetical protein
MSAYTLSVVQLCPDAYKAAANAIAEGYGYGTGNLSVELHDASDGVWWGCHAWWLPSALDVVESPPEEVPGVAEIMAHVVTTVVDTAGMSPEQRDAAPMLNWTAALAANGLAVVEPAE